MKEQAAAFGIIKAPIDGADRYLVQKNLKWHWFNLVGGKYEVEDCNDLRNTVIRELSDELSIRFGKDFQVEENPSVIYKTEHFSRFEKIVKKYEFAAYKVEFPGDCDALIEHLSLNPLNQWLDQQEILSGMTHDQQPVSYLPKELLILCKEIVVPRIIIEHNFEDPAWLELLHNFIDQYRFDPRYGLFLERVMSGSIFGDESRVRGSMSVSEFLSQCSHILYSLSQQLPESGVLIIR